MSSRFSITLLAVLALLVPALSVPVSAVEVPAAIPEFASSDVIHVRRDSSGVAHVIASSTAGAYWGFGYCLARDRLLQLELLRRSVQGTLAEVFGPTFLEQDVLARRDGLTLSELREGYERSGQSFRLALSAFTRGVNAAYEAASRGRFRIHPAFKALGLTFRPFTELEVLEIFAGTMACRYNDFTQELDNQKLLSELVKRLGARSASRIFDDVVPFVDPGVYATLGKRDHFIPALPGTMRLGPHPQDMPAGESPTLRRLKRNRDLKTIGIPDKSGSYAAVLSLRAQGRPEALLLGGPQMGYFTPSAVYEIGLHTPDFDLVGATPVGYFVILFGANRHLGFTATAGVANQVDVLMFTRDASETTRLVGDRCETAVQKRNEHFLIKGRPQAEERVIETTDLGPIIGGKNQVCYVKHRGWKNRVIDSYEGWFESNHATTLEQWLTASDRMALSINWLGADRQGHLAYVYCGLGKSRHSFGDDRLPARRPAMFPFPDARLCGTDPTTGFYANWNCPPVTGFRNGDMQTGWSADQRSRFLADRIESGRGTWSVEFLKRLDREIAFTDQRAYFFKDDLVQLLRKDYADQRLAKAVQELRNWDGTRSDLDDDGRFDRVGPRLFDAWWNRIFASLFGDILGEMAWIVGSDPTWTQSILLKRALFGQSSFDYLRGRSAEAVVTEALASAVADIASAGRELDPGPAPSMEFSGVNHAGVPSQCPPATFTPYLNRGSDVQIMHLTPDGISILGVLPPGNAEIGPHAVDQIEPFRTFAWRERPLMYRDVRRVCQDLVQVRVRP